MKSYHNTTGLNGSELKQAQEKAQSQDEIILGLFRQTNISMSACDVFKLMNDALMIQNVLLTSVRRSINTLMKQGHLQQMEQTKIGIYKRPVHLYGLPEQLKGQLQMFNN